MDAPETIRLLAPTANARGGLFTQLMKDLFFALGYDDLRLNVHKTGRELDIQGQHRFENRRVVAECKAHDTKMGGAELNKFLGVLTRERKKAEASPVSGYFVSLSGFTESAIEQEKESGEDCIITLTARQVIDQLEKSRVVIALPAACERSGQCAQHNALADVHIEGAELLGHKLGYMWAVYFSQGKEPTHFTLIHADGTPLANLVAKDVVAADRKCGGLLHSLQYLAPPAPAASEAKWADAAKARYLAWLEVECGFIQLDGLPADTDLSATRMKLERLFVPLKAVLLRESDDHRQIRKKEKDKVRPVGNILSKAARVAILAAPGGGKSTLLKRLAIAYGFPARRTEVDDALPHREWLPLLLRCRELRDRAHRPLLELLHDLSSHAGMSDAERAAFRQILQEALQRGTALLLVDGLDEITEEGARRTFAAHLRTFTAVFPQAALVVTSREAGYRLVSGVIAGACNQVRVAPLNEADVVRLCESWHAEVVGSSAKVRSEARQLAETIWNNERIRSLAENPLLLTTLLVVKRWIGELPRNRAALYREAIRVLLRTWNVEGYTPLDEDETLAQLSYVACGMMQQGIQQVGQKALLRLLQEARHELEAELQFSVIAPAQFIERIEYRSSLLMQVGHGLTENELQPVYEFRHLTFQEYLAARGLVEEQYPGRNEGKPLADLLEQHFEDERWREVIPLAATLAGRKAEDVIRRLTSVCQGVPHRPVGTVHGNPMHLLYLCLMDEAQATIPTLRAALLQVGRFSFLYRDQDLQLAIGTIMRSKYGQLFVELVEQSYLECGEHWTNFAGAMAGLAWITYGTEDPKRAPAELLSMLLKSLQRGDRKERVYAALACMSLAFDTIGSKPQWDNPSLNKYYPPLRDALGAMLRSDNRPEALAACWALAWFGEKRISTVPPSPSLVLSIWKVWRAADSESVSYFSSWALASQPLLPRASIPKDAWGECDEFLRNARGSVLRGKAASAPLVVSWYRCAPWSDTAIAGMISESVDQHWPTQHELGVRDLLQNLGEAGRPVLERLNKLEP